MKRDGQVNLVGVLLVILILALLGVLPVWGYSHAWGVWPGSVLSLLLFIVVLKAFGVL